MEIVIASRRAHLRSSGGVAACVAGEVAADDVAGRVAASREILLVQDVAEAHSHPLLRDQYFTTGSFISFPLVLRGELLGVVNLTNRARQGVFTEEDVERVRLLGHVISLIVTHARLAERLIETLGVA